MIKTSRVPVKSRSSSSSQTPLNDKNLAVKLASMSVANLSTSQSQYPSEDHMVTAIACLKDHLKNPKVIAKLASRLETLVSMQNGLTASRQRVAQDFIQAYRQSFSKIPSQKKQVQTEDTQTFESESFVHSLIQTRVSSLMKNRYDAKTSDLPVPLGGSLRKAQDLKDFKQSVLQGLLCIQRYLNHLSYNHVGSIQLFTIKKSQPMYLLVRTAKEIIKQGLPIKCLEAVLVSLFLALDFRKLGVKVFPMAFKTVLKADEGIRDRHFLHIVLVVYFEGRFGALGLSRKPDLMNKTLEFRTLSDLIEEYRICYEFHGHQVIRLRLGETITHSVNEPSPLDWRFAELSLPRKDWNHNLVEVFSNKYLRDQHVVI